VQVYPVVKAKESNEDCLLLLSKRAAGYLFHSVALSVVSVLVFCGAQQDFFKNYSAALRIEGHVTWL
jgi:hypothetical protein